MIIATIFEQLFTRTVSLMIKDSNKFKIFYSWENIVIYTINSYMYLASWKSFWKNNLLNNDISYITVFYPWCLCSDLCRVKWNISLSRLLSLETSQCQETYDFPYCHIECWKRLTYSEVNKLELLLMCNISATHWCHIYIPLCSCYPSRYISNLPDLDPVVQQLQLSVPDSYLDLPVIVIRGLSWKVKICGSVLVLFDSVYGSVFYLELLKKEEGEQTSAAPLFRPCTG